MKLIDVSRIGQAEKRIEALEKQLSHEMAKNFMYEAEKDRGVLKQHQGNFIVYDPRWVETTISNLKCCGNCNHYAKRSDCVTKHEYLPYRYCEQWQSDGMTRKEREG